MRTNSFSKTFSLFLVCASGVSANSAEIRSSNTINDKAVLVESTIKVLLPA
jgi:hypothetical protein